MDDSQLSSVVNSVCCFSRTEAEHSSIFFHRFLLGFVSGRRPMFGSSSADLQEYYFFLIFVYCSKGKRTINLS